VRIRRKLTYDTLTYDIEYIGETGKMK